MNAQSQSLRPCLRPVMRCKRDRSRIPNGGLNWPLMLSFVFAIVFWSLFFCFVCHAQVMQPAVDMAKIAMIESSGNPRAWRKIDDSRGLFQITPVVLKEWNRFNPSKKYTRADLWDPKINFEIASWYMTKRIPQFLRHFRVKDTVETRIICYNAGIDYLVVRKHKKGKAHAHKKSLPKTTRIYLAKYQK